MTAAMMAPAELPESSEPVERSKSTRFAELVDRTRPVCAEAVDPLEVAAVLEAGGLSDAVAAERYGARDVFELAERLFASTARDPAAAPPVPGPWRVMPPRHLARGVLFALPGVCYAAVSGVVSGRLAIAVVLCSLLLSWSFSQALAYLGSVRIGNGDPAGALRMLRAGLAWGVTVAVVSAAALVAAGWVPRAVAVVAAAQAMYLVAATVVLVCERESLLALALAPATIAVGSRLLSDAAGGLPRPLSDLAGGLPRPPDSLAIAAVAVTVLATVVAARRVTRGARGDRLLRAEAVAAAMQGVFGLLVAGLLVFVPVTCGLLGFAGGEVERAMVLAVPLTLSMGPAEWIMFGYRSATYRWLQRTCRLWAFRWSAAAALLVAIAGYLAVLAAGLAATAWLFPASERAVSGYLVLGGALFVALLLIGSGVRAPVLWVCAGALVVEYAAAPRFGVLDAQIVAAAGVLAILFGWALVVFSRATHHH